MALSTPINSDTDPSTHMQKGTATYVSTLQGHVPVQSVSTEMYGSAMSELLPVSTKKIQVGFQLKTSLVLPVSNPLYIKGLNRLLSCRHGEVLELDSADWEDIREHLEPWNTWFQPGTG